MTDSEAGPSPNAAAATFAGMDTPRIRHITGWVGSFCDVVSRHGQTALTLGQDQDAWIDIARCHSPCVFKKKGLAARHTSSFHVRRELDIDIAIPLFTSSAISSRTVRLKLDDLT